MLIFICRYPERVSHPSPFPHSLFHLLPQGSSEVGDRSPFEGHPPAQDHLRSRLRNSAVDHPGKFLAVQWGQKAGGEGAAAKGLKVWANGLAENLIGWAENWNCWTETMLDEDVLADRPFEPRELVEGLCPSILGPACAGSEP